MPSRKDYFTAGRNETKRVFISVSAMLPLLLGVVPFGLVFGVLGISSGLSETETILMSSIIFAGASQVVFAQLWAAGSAYIVIGSSVALINLRQCFIALR